MGSFIDARVRLVEMDKQAVAGLNRSRITLKEYRAPTGFPAVVFAVCLGTYILLSRKANMLPGSLLYDNILKYVPSFAHFSYTLRDYVIWPMLAIHITEAYIMTNTLKKHSVPLFSRLWWLWTTSCFIEGFNAFQRFEHSDPSSADYPLTMVQNWAIREGETGEAGSTLSITQISSTCDIRENAAVV